VDLVGNLYVADSSNDIRKITPAGVVTTLAGNPYQWGSADGAGGAAEFNNPQGVAVDGAGNVYVADTNNETIRMITPAGTVTTLAGSPGQYGSNDGVGGSARFSNPRGVAVDASGNVYVADTNNQTIRMITPAGVVTTLAGSQGQYGNNDGSGNSARFGNPSGIGVDGAGNVYVADANNNTIRLITPAGVVTTVGGAANQSGGADGFGSAARFDYPLGVAVDGAGNLYVADSGNSTIRVGVPTLVVPVSITAQPQDSTINAGQSTSFSVAASGTTPFAYRWQLQYSGSLTWTDLFDGGEYSGTATATLIITGATSDLDQARFQCVVSNGAVTTSNPATLTVNYSPGVLLQSGNETAIAGQSVSFSVGVNGSPGPSYQWQESTDGGTTWTNITDGNGISGSGTATLVVGAVTSAMSGDQFRLVSTNPSGSVTSAPATLTVTPLQGGDVLAYDFTTLAGVAPGSADGTGAAAQFNQPSSVAVDGAGNVYVADSSNDTIRKMSPAGVVTTLAGSPGQRGSADGTGSAARFNSPQGVAVDGAGNVYVADSDNQDIRKITPAGVVTTLAGSPGPQGSADGEGAAAQFSYPRGVAVDSSGNVYVADANNDTIREITPAGVVATLAGTAGQPGSADGTGAAALFNYPTGVTVDGSGNVYVADTNNQTIREITPAGVVTTLAGAAGQGGNSDGTAGTARFSSPRGVAADGSGNVYVADSGADTIREITQSGVVTTVAGSSYQLGSLDGNGNAARFSSPQSVAVFGSGNVYVADRNNNTIREVTLAGAVTTLAGAPGQAGNVDGTGSAARFNFARGTAVNAAGTIYVADTNSCTIRQITPSGVVTTLAGAANQGGTSDGTGTAARFQNPQGIAVDNVGNIYVADGNNLIRKRRAVRRTHGRGGGQFRQCVCGR
jgi:hypothetical protein